MKDNRTLTERHVQAIWFDRDLRPDRLVTETGEAVHVVHPGEWNSVKGPDFKNAVLEIGTGRTRFVGDVEVHLTPSDWDAHGHGNDPAYRNVVAHVTWKCGVPPLTLPPGTFSICLGRFLKEDVDFALEGIDLDSYPDRHPTDERPCHRQIRLEPERAQRILADAGKWRLKAKAERLTHLLETENRQQLFYSELMNALGYGKNGEGFRAIAASVPYSAIAAEPEITAVAFRAAATFVEWNRDHVRPSNAPERRLEAAARLFSETNVMTLSEVCDVSEDACRSMLKVLTQGGCIGRGRAAAILANVVIPFALAGRRIVRVPPWLPPEDICEPIRRVARRMFGLDHNPRAWYAANGLFMQGLVQIDRECCARLHPDCTGCLTLAA